MPFEPKDKLIFTLAITVLDLVVVYYFPYLSLGALLLSLGVLKLLQVKRAEFIPLVIAVLLLNVSQPYTVVFLALATAFAWVPYSYSFFIALGASILSSYLDSSFQFLSLLSLLILMRYFNLEIRGFVVSGIALLIYSAVTLQFSGPLADVSYFDLVVGVIGVASETTVGRRFKAASQYVLLAFPSLVFALLGLPNSLYYLETGSFLFKLDPFSLWFPGIGYYPLLNQFLLLFVERHFLGWYSLFFVPVLAYLASLSSFFAFRHVRLRPTVVWAVLYGLLTPYWAPQLLLPYIALPFVFLLVERVKSRTILTTSAMALASLASTSPSFPFIIPFASLLGQRKGLFFPLLFASLGASAFWLLPYFVLGYNEAYQISFPLALVALVVAVPAVLANEVKDKYVPLVAVSTGLFMLLDYQFSLSVYPLFVFSLLLSASQIAEEKLAVLKGLVLASAIALSVFSIVSFAQAPSSSNFSNLSQVKGGLTDFVYWVGNYNLSSPNLLSSLAFSHYVVNYTSKGVNVTAHEAMPYVVKALPVTRPNAQFSVRPISLSSVKVINVSGAPAELLWYPTMAPGYPNIFLMLQYLSELKVLHVVANYSQIKAVVLLYNGSSVTQGNVSIIEIPKGAVGLYLVATVSSTTPIAITQIYGVLENESTVIYLGFPKNVTFPEVTYKILENGLLVYVNSSIQFFLNATAPDNFTYLVFQGSKAHNVSGIFPPGKYEILVEFKYAYLEFYGAVITVVSYAVALAQSLIASLATKVWRRFAGNQPKSS